MRRLLIPVSALLLAVSACTALAEDAPPQAAETRVAYFAGGCFWCIEADFEKLDGVIEAVSGYMGGHTKNPTYESTSTGTTGHAETVMVTYDPRKLSYADLLDYYWPHIDPLTANAQFCDRGSQYRSAIFASDEKELQQAQASSERIEKQLGRKVVTEIALAGPFTTAEEYHQDYYKKKKLAYNYYRFGCGRDRRLEEIWGKKKVD